MATDVLPRRSARIAGESVDRGCFVCLDTFEELDPSQMVETPCCGKTMCRDCYLTSRERMNAVCGHCRRLVVETEYRGDTKMLILPEDARVINLMGRIQSIWGLNAREQFLNVGNAAHITLRKFPEFSTSEVIREVFNAFVNAMSVKVRNLPNLGKGIRITDTDNREKRVAGCIQEPVWFHLICSVSDHLQSQGVSLDELWTNY